MHRFCSVAPGFCVCNTAQIPTALDKPVHMLACNSSPKILQTAIRESPRLQHSMNLGGCYRNEVSDSQAQAEGLQAELRATEQQHATTVTSMQRQHCHALTDLQQEQQQQLQELRQQHEAAMQALQVGPTPHDPCCDTSYPASDCLF